MMMEEIKNLYEECNLEDYKLTSIEDIQIVHKINVLDLEGYDNLVSDNQELFNKFIINFFNAQGLEMRNTLYPISVDFVREVEFLGKENLQDDYYIIIGGKVEIFKNGKFEPLSEWKDEDCETECLKQEETQYLRFVYEINNRKEWQHILNENEWY